MSRARFYIGLFSITAATLMLQLIQTRILSVVSGYHLAFFAISMAIPFFFSGVVVSIALTRSPFPIGRVYGVDR